MVIFTVVSIALSGFAFADMLFPTDDARVWQLLPDENYGALDNLTVGYLSGCFNTFIKFDLSPYMGATITNAMISLYVYDYYGGLPISNVWVATNDADWGEGSLIWNNRPGTVDTLSLTSPGVIGWWEFFVTAWVQDMVDGTEPNYGFQIYNVNPVDEAFYMDSKEGSAHPPNMMLDYTPSAIESASLGEIKAAFK